MRLEIKGLQELRDRLSRAQVAETAARALAAAAEQLAESVKNGLAAAPGSGDHDRPWLRTGALRDSIGAQADGLSAAVGSNDPAAAPQEMGTVRLPPRPFLAPVAAGAGEAIADGIGAAVAAVLKGEPPDAGIILVRDASGGRPLAPYNPLGVFVPGSPENEAFIRGTERGLRALGQVFHSDQNDAETGDTTANPAPAATPGEATLPDDRRRYILDGDADDGGGHGPGRTTPGKSVFPSDWSDERAIEAIQDIANDPASQRETNRRGRTIIRGSRDGVDIMVIVGADGRTIINAYPTNLPRNRR